MGVLKAVLKPKFIFQFSFGGVNLNEVFELKHITRDIFCLRLFVYYLNSTLSTILVKY